jgi:hypothetical protein
VLKSSYESNDLEVELKFNLEVELEQVGLEADFSVNVESIDVLLLLLPLVLLRLLVPLLLLPPWLGACNVGAFVDPAGASVTRLSRWYALEFDERFRRE